MLILIIEALVHISEFTLRTIEVRIERSNAHHILDYLSILIFTLYDLQLIYPIKIHIEETGNSFRKVFYCAFLSINVLYWLFGQLLALRFGNKTEEIVLYNYGKGDMLIFVVKILYTLTLFINNCITIFPVYNTMYDSRLIKSISEQNVR